MILRLTKLIVLMLISCTTIAQEKRDYQWILGDRGEGNGVIIDFNTIPPNVSQLTIGLRAGSSNTSMCDADGRLLFYSNGCYIANREHQQMDNSDSLTSGFLYDEACRISKGGSAPMAHGVLSLPYPGQQDRYLLFNLDLTDLYKMGQFYLIAPVHMYYQEIDMSANDSLGRVIAKNQVAIQDTLGSGITAVPHANGTDWWVLVAKQNSNCYFLIQVSEQGVHAPLLKCTGLAWSTNDSGSSTFSPDTRKFLRFNYFNGLHVYDFDNATGELSNHKQMYFPNDTFPANSGISVSPSSRYAYASTRNRLYQIDLEAEDIEAGATMVGVLDAVSVPYNPSFHRSNLAPDGKIYIIGRGSSNLMHIIHRPDCPGVLCQVEQRALEIPVLSHGAILASPHFKNMPSGVDCDSILSSDLEANKDPNVKVFPVPASDWLTVETGSDLPQYFELWDITGRQLISTSEFRQSIHLDMTDISSGIYFYRISSADGRISKKGKLIVTASQ